MADLDVSEINSRVTMVLVSKLFFRNDSQIGLLLFQTSVYVTYIWICHFCIPFKLLYSSLGNYLCVHQCCAMVEATDSVIILLNALSCNMSQCTLFGYFSTSLKCQMILLVDWEALQLKGFIKNLS